MTLLEWSNSQHRADLEKLMQHPAMIAALDLLKDDNLDDKVFETHAAIGQDYLEAMALDSVRRGGGQKMINRLKRLPYVTNDFAAKVAKFNMGGGWEHFKPEDRTQPDIKVEPPPSRKPKSKS